MYIYIYIHVFIYGFGWFGCGLGMAGLVTVRRLLVEGSPQRVLTESPSGPAGRSLPPPLDTPTMLSRPAPHLDRSENAESGPPATTTIETRMLNRASPWPPR